MMSASRIAVALAVVVGYVVTGKLGLHFAFLHASATPIWPPTGIALAALLLLGYSLWPAVFVGAFVVNVTTAGSVATALGIGLGNTLEAVIGAWLVNRFAGGAAAFERARDIFRFVALGGLVSTTISATIGVTTLALAGYASWVDYRPVWFTWWLGDAAGDLIVAPLILLWARERYPGGLRGRLPEALLLLVCVVNTGLLVFGGVLPAGMRNAPIAFLCLPVLLWATFRFGPRELATVIAVVSTIAMMGTLRGSGPFSRGKPNEALLLLQGFMATVAVTLAPVAALVHEWRRAEQERAHLLVEEQAARGEAETANRVKDQFLAMLSHELRNPLGAITTAVHLLKLVDPAAAQGREALRVVERQTAHLARLVDDLLDVSRVMAGKISLDRRPLDLSEVVGRALAALAGHEWMSRHTVDVRTDPVWVFADATRMDQVVTNLVENAAKYTPTGGRIAVTLREEQRMAVLTVADTGSGMPPELVPHVFELFVQGSRSLERASGGLGVGLTLVRRLVELHDGSVQAASEGLGRGSRFTVRLPVTAARATAGVSAATAPSPLRRRVLVVEDNDDAREMLRDLLRRLGHEVYETVDGIGGVEKALALRPDLTLVDVGLPGIDGYAVASRLRDHPTGRRLRLVALTGYGLPEDRERALAAGFDAHVVKPVDLEKLRTILAES
jgi:signal transduction histidine kinase